MLFDIMSERNAIAFSNENDILPTAIISIRDYNDGEVTFAINAQILGVLHLNFYDSTQMGVGSMTPADADKIVSFVMSLPRETEQLVIHCTEGISRSSAVCAALMKYFNGSDSEVWQDRSYHPNTLCYRLMIDALNRYNAIAGKPSICGRVYKGAFWFKGLFEMIPCLIPCDLYGNPTPDYFGEGTTNPRLAWHNLPDYITEGKCYNSYPRGRVEIEGKVATVYMDKCLDDSDSKRIIVNTFMLYPECGIERVDFKRERKGLFGIF